MNIEVRLCPKEQSFIIHNLYPLYLHDMSEIWGTRPNPYGIFDEDAGVRTLSEVSERHENWWEQPSDLFPYLITVDGSAAGFALVTDESEASSPNTKYHLNDYFVLRAYRRQGVAQKAAVQLFNQLQGGWELQTNSSERNMTSQIFWRRTLDTYTGGKYTEGKGVHPKKGDMLVFRFSSNR